MRHRGHGDACRRAPAWMRRITLVVAAGLLLGTVDLHALIHHRQNLAGAELAADHPKPAHLDTARGVHELPCLACTVGLKTLGRPADAPGSASAPADGGWLAPETSTPDVDRVAYRLPLSRAPPLS